MNQALKQRLVGALVLVALAVIFLPAFFNGGRPHDSDIKVDIPPAPDMAPFEFKEAVSPNRDKTETPPPAEWYAGDKAADTSLIKEVTRKTAPPGLDSTGKPRGWVLQVASFSEKAKAEALKKNLQTKGYRSFVRTVSKDGRPVSRVLIGPEMDEAALNKIKATVDRDFHVQSMVTKFEP